MQKQQLGFGVVEVILIVVVLALVGVGGWYVWNANQKSQPNGNNNSNNSSTNNAAVADPYMGWKTYCDDVRKICFKYPTSWTLTESGEGASYSVRLVNPANSVAVTYTRNDTRDGAVQTYYTALVSDLAIVDGKLKAVGGFVASLPLPQVKVVDSALLTQYPLTAGAEASFVDTARFKQTDGTNGSFNATPIGTTFTTDQARVWFEGDDGKASTLIVKSFYLQ